jgi:hypothetical protein
LNNYFEDAKRALEKNVSIQVILENPPIGYTIPNLMTALKRYSNYEARVISEPPHAIVAIFDERRTIVDTSSWLGITETPALWTENSCLISIILDCFEILWKNSKQYPIQ